MSEFFPSEFIVSHSESALRVFFLVLCYPIVLFAAKTIRKAAEKKLTPQMAMLIGKSFLYSTLAIITLMILREFNVKLTPLLGAAGIVGVAVGFASQTSLSNLISGVFLIIEKPFEVGDLIRVDSHLGIVYSIDPLSVKLRTLDNTLIRIPNETMIKSAVTTITAFPIRRMDIAIGVAYKEDIEKVMGLLKEIANSIPEILDEPEPLIVFKNFGDSALEFTLGVWFAKAEYVIVRNQLLPKIKKRFDEEGIEIPFPHRTIYMGTKSEPLPVTVTKESESHE